MIDRLNSLDTARPLLRIHPCMYNEGIIGYHEDAAFGPDASK
jgi:hypothetical protein